MRRKTALNLIKFLLELADEIELTHAEMRGVHKLISRIAQEGIFMSSAFDRFAERIHVDKSGVTDTDEIPF